MRIKVLLIILICINYSVNAQDETVNGHLTIKGGDIKFRDSDGSGTPVFSLSGNQQYLHLDGSGLIGRGNNNQDIGIEQYRFRNLWLNNNAYINGNVGIGTTSPDAKLEVYGGNISVKNFSNVTDNSAIMIAHSINNQGLDEHGTAIKTFVESAGGNIYAMQFFTKKGSAYEQTEKMRIKGNGNVGIGTTNPVAKLEIKGNGTIGGKWTPFNSYLTITEGSNSMIFDPNEIYSNGTTLNIGTSGGNINFRNVNTDGDINDIMTLKSIGNVGIGTTDPKAKLDIGAFIPDGDLGTVFGRLSEGNTSGDGTYLGVKGYGTQQGQYDGKSFSIVHDFYGKTNNSINFFRGGDKTGGFLTFNTNNNIERMRIKSNGNVGIGTTTPEYKLSVDGTIWATEVKISLTQAADWVFNDDYHLRPLSEVASYIKENKHLPEIPSAEEFRKNDLKVSEMTNKLLQKIEELTLYTIEQEEKIKLQKEKEIELEERLLKIEKLLNQ